MKAEIKALWSMRTTIGGEEKKIGELVEVYFGKPLKMIGYAVIENDDQSTAQYFDDYEDAVEKCVHRFGVVRDDICRSAYFAKVCRKPESDDEDIQSFYDHLVNIGFKVEHTGGGCTWWAKYFLDGTYIAISQDGDKTIHPEHLDDCGVLVGLYHGDDCEGEYFDSGTIAGAFALVNVLNTLKESKQFDVVNLDAYEITLKEV